MKERALEISDLFTEQEAEIVENPYRFLGVERDASVRDSRKA